MTTHDPGKDSETGYHTIQYLQKISLPNILSKAIRGEHPLGLWLVQAAPDDPKKIKEVIDTFPFDEKARDASKAQYLLAALEADEGVCLKTRAALYDKLTLKYVNNIYIATKSFLPLTEPVTTESAMADLEALLQEQLLK
jgi:hypothetical protein